MQTANPPLPDLTGPTQRSTILPSRGWVPINFRDIWAHRELLAFLVWRDLKVRYKQTALGAAWAIIQPVTTMIVFSIFFGRLAKIPSDGLPYPIFAYTALLPWGYFAGSLSSVGSSVVGNSHLITKVYFPRLVVPLASVLGGLVDFAIAFVVLIGMMWYYHIQPTWAILLLPLFLLLALFTALGVGLWFSALNVEYRDARFLLPFVIHIWQVATPVVYPSSLLSEPWRTLYGLNPMVGVIEAFRWALLGSQPPGPLLGVSVGIVALLVLSGLFYFRRMEKSFADII